MKILTDINIPQSQEWQDKTTLVQHQQKKIISNVFMKSNNTFIGKIDNYISEILFAVKLFRIRKSFDVIILIMGNSAMIFAFFQKIFWGKKKPLITSGSYIRRQKNFVLYFLKRNLLKLIDTMIVFTTQEIKNYAEYFKLDEAKYRFVYFGHTLSGYDFTIEKGDYIFCSGNGIRDYKVFINAVREIDFKALIPVKDKSVLAGIDIPKNVQIMTVSPQEYRQLMAGSYMTVVPIKKGLMIGGGLQSYLNAMVMGKSVVVSNVAGVEDYVTHKETGLIVPPDDENVLREAIMYLLNNEAEADAIGKRAKKIVTEKYTLENYIKSFFKIISDCVE